MIVKLQLKRDWQEYIIITAFLILYLLVSYFFLRSYFVTEFISFACLILLPYLIIVNKERRGAVRFFILAALFLISAFFTKVTLLYFLSVGFAILFVIETYLGATNYLFLFVWAMLSSAFVYFNNAFGFPIRLQMSKLAGKFLEFAGITNTVLGNVIKIGKTEFSVDPACTGLKMMSVSLLVALFLIAFYQRKTEKSLNFIKTVLILTGVIILNLINNQIRIILLIYLKILPENPMHYILGLIGLTVYVIIPAIYFIRWIYNRTSINKAQKPLAIKSKWLYTILNILLLASILVMGPMFSNKSSNITETPNIILQGYSQESLPFGVTKLEKPDILIYIKPVNRFYEAEHSPTICWVGSGYTYKNVKEEVIGNTKIYSGILQKENDKIYTAWWFDNGDSKTIDQMEWRWKMISTKKNFCLVNVNSGSYERLLAELRYLLNKKILN